MKIENRIKIIDLNKRCKLNKSFIKKIVVRILKILKKSRKTELEIVFLDDRLIKALNKKYKGRNRPTDVLSFRIDRKEFGSSAFLGEAFISAETAKKNAKVFGTDFGNELTLYVIHAILHLFGYDDRTRADKNKMSREENRILELLCKKEDLLKVLMRH